MDNLVSNFLKYILSKNKHRFLNEIIKKKTFDKGEERYCILNMEDLGKHIRMIFDEKMQDFRDNNHDYLIEELSKMKLYLSQIIEVYEGMISISIF